MAVLNKVQLIGYIGHPPRFIKPKDYHLALVSMATNELGKKNGNPFTITEWHTLIFFGKLADNVVAGLQRGNQVYIEGNLRSNFWIDNENIKRKSYHVVVRHIQLLDKTKCGDLPEQLDKLSPEDYLAQMYSLLESSED